MGVDFITKVAPTFHRALDRRAVELRTPKFFTQDIPYVARSASANICHGSQLKVGEKLLLRVLADKVVAQRGNLIVAEFSNPPTEFLNHLRAGAGAEIGEVKSIGTISQVVEVGFCE
jgi:hypothetical protein